MEEKYVFGVNQTQFNPNQLKKKIIFSVDNFKAVFCLFLMLWVFDLEACGTLSPLPRIGTTPLQLEGKAPTPDHQEVLPNH